VVSGMLLCATAYCLGAAAESRPSASTSRATGSAPAALSPARVRELLLQLDDRRWAVRDRATAELKTAGRERLDDLAVAYKAARSWEVRLRIKEVAAHIFLTSELKMSGGFLGVRHRMLTEVDQANQPVVQGGMRIVEVLPNTAAQAAGLMPGDTITAIDGQALRADQGPDDFARRIGRLTQGSRVRLTVLRGEQSLDVPVTLGARPLEFNDQRTEEYVKAQGRFAAMWRSRFDANDRNLNMAQPEAPAVVRPDAPAEPAHEGPADE